ncbi:MAG: transaldolase [Rhodospirillales bacterium]|jgi:transaldolase|nr:transaldolase [Rhodospirillales bacterium]
MNVQTYKSPLHKMSVTTPTDLWNDSCSVSELEYSIDNGCVGATANPVIVAEVLKKERAKWEPTIRKLIADNPTASEDDIAWKLVEEMSKTGAKLLLPIFEKGDGKVGRLSLQTNPQFYRNADRMVEQAVRFDALAPNMIIKIPVTAAGIEAIEEVTFRGVSINATVSFCVAQAIAVAEAVERGLDRREKAGHDISRMGSVCTLMVGRMDDWLKVVAAKEDIITNPENLDWAGVAMMKKAYQIYQERGYRVRALSAATRNHRHWSEFIGGDVVVTLTHGWQKRFNGSDIDAVPRMDIPVDPAILAELDKKFVDFRKGYDEKGMTPAEFDSYGPTKKTLSGFIGAQHDFVGDIRSYMIPGV